MVLMIILKQLELLILVWFQKEISLWTLNENKRVHYGAKYTIFFCFLMTFIEFEFVL